MKSATTALERTNTRPARTTRPARPATGSASSADGTPVTDDGQSTVPRRRFKEVWLVEDRREGKSIWTRVGVAFENTDGSWNIRLSALPVGGGRLNMRDPLPATDRADRLSRAERAEPADRTEGEQVAA